MNQRPPANTIQGLEWPRLPGLPGTRSLALLFLFEQTQWFSPEALRHRQFRQLSQLLQHACNTVSYYRERRASYSLPPERDWERIPVLRRAEVQRYGDAMYSREMPRGHGKIYVSRTSGSTGMPVQILRTQLNHLLWQTFLVREHLWHRRDLSTKLASIRHSPDQGTEPSAPVRPWGDALRPLGVTGPAVTLPIAAPVSTQVDWLLAERPDYLLTYPSNLRSLLDEFDQRGEDPAKLRGVITMAEALPDDLRELCCDRLGVPLVDIYSSQEIGYLALQCPDHEHYHIQSEGVLLEVLDDDDRPCAAGETGRVVVTSLHNFAMPLIRYELGDYAEVGEPCPCGRGLPVLRRILGRVRNVLVAPNGERYWPRFGSRSLMDIAPIRQHQFVQTASDRIEARLVTARPLTVDEEQKITEHLVSRLPCRFEIEFSYHREIPRSSSGKFEDFRSEIAPAA